MEKKIIAFVGNASVGKTTVLTKVIYQLKKEKQKVGYVFDSIRGTLMDMSILDCPEGRKLVLFKHLANEYTQLLRKDTEFILLDRSIIDWFAYLRLEMESLGRLNELNPLEEFIFNELKKYHKICYFVTEGMHYIKDGFRPPDDNLRENVEKHYRYLIDKCVSLGLPVFLVKGNDVDERYENTIKVIKDE